MNTTIEIQGQQKKALVDIVIDGNRNDPDSEITILGLTTFTENGKIAYYGKKQCAKHQWPLYKAIKKHLYE